LAALLELGGPPQHGITTLTERPAPEVAQESTARTSSQKGPDQLDQPSQPLRAPRVGRHDSREPLREDDPRTCGLVTEEAAYLQLEVYGDLEPGKVCHPTDVARMHPFRPGATDRTLGRSPTSTMGRTSS
jgi:hypothetical protein